MLLFFFSQYQVVGASQVVSWISEPSICVYPANLCVFTVIVFFFPTFFATQLQVPGLLFRKLVLCLISRTLRRGVADQKPGAPNEVVQRQGLVSDQPHEGSIAGDWY